MNNGVLHAKLEKYISKLKKNELPISGSEKLEKQDHCKELIFNGLRTAKGIQINKINLLDLIFGKSCEIIHLTCVSCSTPFNFL